MPFTIEPITIEQPAHEHIGMRIGRVHIQDACDARTGSRRLREGAPRSQC
jgi:hypothetical protein